jgi:hypothetical protein
MSERASHMKPGRQHSKPQTKVEGLLLFLHVLTVFEQMDECTHGERCLGFFLGKCKQRHSGFCKDPVCSAEGCPFERHIRACDGSNHREKDCGSRHPPKVEVTICECVQLGCNKKHPETCGWGRFCKFSECSKRHVTCPCLDASCKHYHEDAGRQECLRSFCACSFVHPIRARLEKSGMALLGPDPNLLCTDAVDNPSFSVHMRQVGDFPDPNHLGVASATLLSKMQPEIFGGVKVRMLDSRLDLNTLTWGLQLVVSADYWFQNLITPKENRLQIARAWVDKTKEEYRLVWHASNDDGNVVREPFARIPDHLIEKCRGYCRDDFVTHRRNLEDDFETKKSFSFETAQCRRDYTHPSGICIHEVDKDNGTKAACGWYVMDTLCVQKLCSDYWVVLARFDEKNTPIRELLVFPRPSAWKFVVGLANGVQLLQADGDAWGHRTNFDLCRMPFFWKSLQDISNLIVSDFKSVSGRTNASLNDVIELYRLNFGRWESRMAADPNALQCHGHAHIVLSAEAQRCLCNLEEYEVLRGRTEDPKAYDSDEAKAFELQVLLSAEQKKIQEEVAQMRSDISEIKELQAKQFEQIMEQFKKLTPK